MIMSVFNEFHSLCRLCGTKTEILSSLPIFDPEKSLQNIEEKINACLPIQVSMNDDLPKLVCQGCAYQLDKIVDFREKCCQTETIFMKMLKSLQNDAANINETMTKSIDRNLSNSCNIKNKCIIRDDVGNDDNFSNENSKYSNEEAGSDDRVIHTIQVVDSELHSTNIDHQEEIQQRVNEIEVNNVNCLDGSTVAIVDERIDRQGADHQITMHLEGNITIVDQFGINYVATIDSNSSTQQSIADYCNDVKYETIIVKEEFQRLHQALDIQKIGNNSIVVNENDTETNKQIHTSPAINGDHQCAPMSISNSSQSPNSSVSNISSYMTKKLYDEALENKNATSLDHSLMKKQLETATQYTKDSKNNLLEAILSNPTMDETGISWYICTFCSEATTEADSLAKHINQHFSSCICGLSFTNINDFDNHKQGYCDVKELKKNSVDNECKTIKESLIAVTTDVANCSNVENNRKTQANNNRQKWTPKICTQCGKQYRTNYKLQEHMRKHTGEKPFQCLLCEKAFRSKIGLAQHTATHTGKFDYNCSTCGKGFQCKSYLIVHQRVHSDLKPYPCDTCGQNFKTKQSLLDHQNRHLGVKPYICEICGRGFITKGLCKSHQKIHSGMDNRQYPCQVCNKMFVSKSYLNTHLRIHTGEKPYLCEVCGKGFLTRVDLRIHSTMHTGEKSFKCEMCNKVFARRAALRCHRRSHTGERPYRCDVCGKTFTQFSPMAIHKRLHTGERPYQCDICEKTFVSRSTMMCHRKKHHLPTLSSVETEINTDNIPTDIQ